MPRTFFVCISILSFTALSCGQKSVGPCDGANPLSGCGASCDAAKPFCSEGLYCGSGGTCTADCKVGDNAACQADQVCSHSGRCITDGASAATSNICTTSVDGKATTPYAYLFLDRSGSMFDNKFPEKSATTRWDALRNLLIGTDATKNTSVIGSLQNKVAFSLTDYTGGSSKQPGACVSLNPNPVIKPSLNALNTITANYSSAKGGNTPTGESIAKFTAMIDPKETSPNPTIMVLATDGEPDTCAAPDANGSDAAHKLVEDAVDAGFKKGIFTYVIFVGTDTSSATHLQRVANLGLGKQADATGTDAGKPFSVTEPAQLQSAFNDILGGYLDCNIALTSGAVDAAQACSGTVKINGSALECNSDNGWRLTDPTHIQVTGSACEALKASPDSKVEANFPCGAVSPITAI